MPTRSQPIPSLLPVLPLREQVIFPAMSTSVFVPESRRAIVEEAGRCEQLLVAAACFGRGEQDSFVQLARLATVCRVGRLEPYEDGGGKLPLEGLARVHLVSCAAETPCIQARIRLAEEASNGGLVTDALVQSASSLLKIALAHGRPLPGDAIRMIDRIDDAGRLADLVAVYLSLELTEQQRVLEILDPLERLKLVYLRLTATVQALQVREEIQQEVAKKVGKSQKEYLLREQMKQIREELGDDDPRQNELQELRSRIEQQPLPDPVRELARKELKRLERINPASPDHNVLRTYLETLLGLPWLKGSADNLDIEHAARVLDEDHHGLKEVKERILEFLSVRALKPDGKGPILCLVGPPGVGKTSLGRSVARALGRKFIRLSLGGMHDEAEIRGHRRTYIGALPGRILRELARAGNNNPVFMLDELDKVGKDFRGDPASALLEALDPEQNDSFSDHYVELPFDLSKVMFITTANQLDPVPPALRDRLEVIRLTGYGDEEKLHIAFDHLIPKQLRENGLSQHPLAFTRSALLTIIGDYTREAGVRELERRIGAICRKIARLHTQHREVPMEIDRSEVLDLLGARRFFSNVAGEQDRVGVVTGLAWTEAGGDILFVEAARMAGEKGLTLTGNLGEVMQESARTALSHVREHAAEYGIDPAFFASSDLHIHVPSGAIPKDGPSAGVTIAVALISLLTGRPARREVAMTGELTLSGRILPVGGVKEKVLAARRAGVRTVLLPERNRENVNELDAEIQQGLRLLLVDDLQLLVELALHPRQPADEPFQPLQPNLSP